MRDYKVIIVREGFEDLRLADEHLDVMVLDLAVQISSRAQFSLPASDTILNTINQTRLLSRRSPYSSARVTGRLSMYRSLDSEKIIETVGTLVQSIDARFPESGLHKVCQELLAIARESHERSVWIAKPQIWLRAITGTLILIMIGGLVLVLMKATWPSTAFDLILLVQVSEAAMNVFILLSAAILFLATAESRIKRAKALKAIHELRALAHVIDMHQLTKDPEPLLSRGNEIASTARKTLSPAELMRYLDCCSEMLSLIGKLAALYVQKFDDPVALAAVNEVETLTTGLSNKIWQKIMILYSGPANERG